MLNRDVYIFPKSPPDQYSISKIKTTEVGEEKELNLPSKWIRKCSHIFWWFFRHIKKQIYSSNFHRSRHYKADIYYLSQSYFDSPQGTIRNDGNKIILLNQTFKFKENKYRDVCLYDMSYDDYKRLCRKAWEDECFYLCIDSLEK